MRGEPIVRTPYRRTGKIKFRIGRTEFEVPEHLAAVSLFLIISVVLLFGVSRPLSQDRSRISLKGTASIMEGGKLINAGMDDSAKGQVVTGNFQSSIRDDVLLKSTGPETAVWADLLHEPLIQWNAASGNVEGTLIGVDRPLMLFFGASWCSATMDFLPGFKRIYSDLMTLPTDPAPCADVLHIPSDSTAEDLKNLAQRTFANGWYTLMDPQSDLVKELKKQYSICGMNEMGALGIQTRKGELPSVVVVDPRTGKVLVEATKATQMLKDEAQRSGGSNALLAICSEWKLAYDSETETMAAKQAEDVNEGGREAQAQAQGDATGGARDIRTNEAQELGDGGNDAGLGDGDGGVQTQGGGEGQAQT